jgi:hypothetical protein
MNARRWTSIANVRLSSGSCPCRGGCYHALIARSGATARLGALDQLVETLSGWLYVTTGNLFKPEQVQPSQDLHCHVCLGRGGDHRSIYAFIVPNV